MSNKIYKITCKESIPDLSNGAKSCVLLFHASVLLPLISIVFKANQNQAYSDTIESCLFRLACAVRTDQDRRPTLLSCLLKS